MKKRLILIVFMVLLVGVGSLVYLGQNRRRSQGIYYSGTIEATHSDLAFQVNGRVTEVLVDEGQEVRKDQPLARMAQAEFLARRNQVRADLDRSGRTLNQLEILLDLYESTLPSGVARAEAAVKALEANLEELKAGYRAQEVERARLTLDSARLNMEEARKDRNRFDSLYRGGTVSEKERDAVTLRYEKALKEYEGAEENYKLLMEGFRKESISAARARVAEGRALLREARANLKKIDATKSEIKAAQAQVRGAEAALEVAELQLSYTRLLAPFKGVVTSRNVEPGEVVSPGREVMTVADLSRVDLKVFVGETEIGRVRPGQKAEVRVDTFPDKVYAGSVSYISPEAEFTPKTIQTRKERVKLVYLVKISIPNPRLELKSGMPADAWFR